MSKDPTQSRIPRIGSSRIPVPGSIIRPPHQFQSKLSRPSSVAIPCATPVSFLRPPRSSAITIARSYSGDKLCQGEPSPFPVLAASTPAPQFKAPPSSVCNLYKKLELVSTENLNDVQPLDNTFAVASPSGGVDFADGRMLVDESLELVGAGSTDNLLLDQDAAMMKQATSNETVTLKSDGNVTYEVKRSETFVKQKQEESSVGKLGGSRESLNRTRGASLFLTMSKSSADSPVLDRTHTLDEPKRALCSTMVGNVTQSIPNITQELLYRTHEINSPDRLLPADPHVVQRPTRLTFNLNETTNLLHLSDPALELNKTQVFSSTMHSPLNVTRNVVHEALDTSAGERTLVAEELDLDDDDHRQRRQNETMDVDDSGGGREIFDLSLEEPASVGREEVALRPLEGRGSIPAKQRFSFGLDLTECTLDCSIELCDSSVSSAKPHVKSPVSTSLTKQGSFEMDESLGILTPDQMKEFLDSTTTNTNNTNNLELQLNTGSHKHGLHHCRIDQTPSPEELPLDPVGVKTDMSDIVLPSEIPSSQATSMYQEISQTDSDSKTDQMTKSATSKVSNSFITSITSITSLDTGYQGDGEMSRPASRGADHSPSNGPRIKNQAAAPWNAPAAPAVPRRQDPMTDSDFFTESDADDVFNRGDRRAQVIDGQLYGPMVQGGNVFINQQPQNEDSCMESSGIFTDVENRGDDDLVHRRSEDHEEEEDEGQPMATESDMSPDASTETISSSNTACSQKKVLLPQEAVEEDQEDANSLRNASLVSSVSTNDASVSSPMVVVQVAEQTFEMPSGDVVVVVVGESAATQNQSPSSPVATSSSSPSSSSSSTATVNGAAAASGGRVDSSASEVVVAARGGPSSDSLSGAVVGSGSVLGSGGKKPSSSRKQQKNESNLVLKKHEMSSRAALIKTRLFKDSVVNGSKSSSSRSVGGSVLSLDAGNECENQENKRPTSGHGGGPRGGVGGGSVGNLSFVKKSATPNKWDAVMSKIAENKAVIKKNFSDVKSKISCGKTAPVGGLVVGRRVDSPVSLKSPPSECASSIGSRSVSTPGGKRTISGSVKRGRTHSKDSQQSSQSDLSLSGGSPKLQPKVSSIRPAKKRDVRTINSSSSDLGPPPKTLGGQIQTQPPHQRTASLRTPATLQKRLPPPSTVTNASIPIVPDQLKGSPPPKRNNLIAKRTLSANAAASANNGVAAVVKTTPLKDHNRLVGPTPTSKPQGVNSPKLLHSKTLSSRSNPPQPSTPLQQQQQQHSTTTTPSGQQNHHHHNNHHLPTVNGTANQNGTTPVTSPTSLKSSGGGLQRNGTIILDKPNAGSPLICPAGDGVASPKVRNGIAKQLQQNGAQGSPEVTPKTKTTATVGTSANANLVDISLLNHANRGVEALGVLVQYLVYNLDAFSCPTIKQSHQKATHDLLETKSMLDDERDQCQSLKQQLLDTTEREAELIELHRCEISKVESHLADAQRYASDRVTALEAELLRKDLEASSALRTRTEEFEAQLAERDAALKRAQAREQELLQRISALSCTENELRDKVHSSELEFAERLQAAAMRERDLSDQLNALNRQMDAWRRAAEHREQDLQDKLCLTQDECTILRHNRTSSVSPSRSSPERSENITLMAATPFAASPLAQNRSSGNLSHTQILQDEVDSLRCVLDLKQREISELRKQTQEYERDARDLPGALVKISALESRIEDLQVQLKTKTEEEKDLQQRYKLLQENLKQETKVKSRLSQHNEELQWKLKQNSEKFSHVYAELSKSYHENSSYLNTTRTSLGGCSERVFEMEDISPPTSPVIKGVVEKSDSVSWVLEMDDEPPEISASRMVRRAGSFRSSYDPKRQKCAALNSSLNGIQQSNSVGSILKQQESVSPSKAGTPMGTPRLRSKSVSIKATEPPKKIVRSNSGASSSAATATTAPSSSKPIRMAEMPLSWKEPPLYSSSPYAHKRFLNERMENGAGKAKDLFLEETEFLGGGGGEADSPYSRSRAGSFGAGPAEGAAEQPVEFFRRDKTPNFKKSKENRGLITCDTKALAAAELAGVGVAAHKKRRDAFARKNLPKEAAGEALVSGSDDEASTSSCLSDDLSSGGHSSSSIGSNSSSGSSSSSSSSTSTGQTSPSSGGEGREALVAPPSDRRASLEDALMQKIVASLNGGGGGGVDGGAVGGLETPMEVSWSEDGDPSESIV
uniref:Putative myosin class ii heavy chain n=3 Tax=Culex tarsalis TaxID=7177 RepID=A0A1Q3G149_CULTA